MWMEYRYIPIPVYLEIMSYVAGNKDGESVPDASTEFCKKRKYNTNTYDYLIKSAAESWGMKK